MGRVGVEPMTWECGRGHNTRMKDTASSRPEAAGDLPDLLTWVPWHRRTRSVRVHHA